MRRYVLVVHSDPTFLSLLLNKLLSQGINVHWASQYQEAIKILEYWPINLLALDKDMITTSSDSAKLKYLAEQVYKIPIFYLSET